MTLQRERVLYRVNRFVKDFKTLPKTVKFEVWEVVEKLNKNVFDPHLDVKKLVGYRDIWRVKVERDFRLIFTFDEDSLTLLRVAHRKDIYRMELNN